MDHNTLLIQQIVAGDAQAFEQLVRRYHRRVYIHIRSWTKNHEDVQEIMQDVFLKVYQNLSSLRQPDRFDAWLRQMTRYECYNRLRKKQPVFQEVSDDLAKRMPGADEQVVQGENLDAIIKAIENLPELERALLKSRYLDDMSYADLQKRHGLSYKAITMRVLRARRKVRDQVDDTSFFELTGDQEAWLAEALEIRANASSQKGMYTMSSRPFDFRAPHAASKDGKFGYINKAGEMIIAPQFDRAMSFCEGLGRVGIGDKQGYVDETGEVVIPLQFDEAYPFSEGFAGVRVGEKFGFIDKSGAFVIEPQFDFVEYFSEGLAAVQMGDLWGFVDVQGNYVVEPQYKKVWPFNDGMTAVNTEDGSGYIDAKGKPIYFW